VVWVLKLQQFVKGMRDSSGSMLPHAHVIGVLLLLLFCRCAH
jgi:hypothetical protein